MDNNEPTSAPLDENLLKVDFTAERQVSKTMMKSSENPETRKFSSNLDYANTVHKSINIDIDED